MNVLLNMQDKDSGLFIEQKGENFGGYVHHPVHTTAHCMAALDLFDAAPLYKPTALNQYFTKEGLTSLLDSLDWEGNPWPQSHQGAGIFVIGELSDSVTEEWREHYFKTLYDFTDSEFGISRSGSHGKSPLYNHLNGWFHYTFNTEYAHKRGKQTVHAVRQIQRIDHAGQKQKRQRIVKISKKMSKNTRL